jgi:hypothetical protein
MRKLILKIPLARTRACWRGAQATERWDGRKGVPRPSQASPGPVKRRLTVWIPQAPASLIHACPHGALGISSPKGSTAEIAPHQKRAESIQNSA